MIARIAAVFRDSPEHPLVSLALWLAAFAVLALAWEITP